MVTPVILVRLTPNGVEAVGNKAETMTASFPAASLIVPPASVISVTVTPLTVESAATTVYSKMRLVADVAPPVRAIRSACLVTPPMVKVSVGLPFVTSMTTASLKVTVKVSLSPVL